MILQRVIRISRYMSIDWHRDGCSDDHSYISSFSMNTMRLPDLTISTVHTGQLRRPIPLLPVQHPRPNPPPLHLLCLQIPLHLLSPLYLKTILLASTPPPILHPLLPPPHLRPTRHLGLLRTRNPKRELCVGHVGSSGRVNEREGIGKDDGGSDVGIQWLGAVHE